MTLAVKSIELSNGVVLSYVEHGDESCVPVVLLHGVTDSWRSFELVFPHLSGSIRALAVTQRGHGNSSRPAAGYQFTDLAQDVARFMDALQLRSAVVAGHSMGSSVAQRFAIDYPDRVTGLVLIGSFATLRGNTAVQEFWETTISKMTDPVEPPIAREFQQSTLAAPIPKEFFETAVQESLELPARVWRALFMGFLEDDFSMELSGINAPTLILWGDQDSFCPRSDQDKLMASIPDARLVVYPGSGHALHWEQPGRFASDLNRFVEALSD